MYTRQMASLDDGLLVQARAAVAHRIEAEAALAHARTDEQLAIRRMQLAGGSVREIAKALGVSHQRIQQMIEAVDDGRGWKRRGRKSDTLACSFCGTPQNVAKKLIAGPGVYICDGCIPKARQGFEAKPKCSFCGKSTPAQPVRGTKTVAICGECLDLCDEILSAEGR